MDNLDLGKMKDRIFDKRFLLVEDDINLKQYDEFVERTFALCMKNKEPINIIFKTNGGQSMYGLSMRDVIMSLPVKTTAYVPQRCHSAGIYPLAVCTERIGMPHSRYFFHSLETKVAILNPHPAGLSLQEQVNQELESAKLIWRNVDDVLLKSLSISKDELTRMQVVGEQTNDAISASRALGIGLLTEIWDGTKEKWFWEKLLS